jgi:hypothetical protein
MEYDKTARTCNRLGVMPALPTRNEHDIALASVRIIVFEKEELVNAVVVKRRHLDHVTDRAS